MYATVQADSKNTINGGCFYFYVLGTTVSTGKTKMYGSFICHILSYFLQYLYNDLNFTALTGFLVLSSVNLRAHALWKQALESCDLRFNGVMA